MYHFVGKIHHRGVEVSWCSVVYMKKLLSRVLPHMTESNLLSGMTQLYNKGAVKAVHKPKCVTSAARICVPDLRFGMAQVDLYPDCGFPQWCCHRLVKTELSPLLTLWSTLRVIIFLNLSGF